jgi:hypothetical protein
MGGKLHVSNLGYAVTDSELEKLFLAHGTVQSAQVVVDRDTGRSKGFTFARPLRYAGRLGLFLVSERVAAAALRQVGYRDGRREDTLS